MTANVSLSTLTFVQLVATIQWCDQESSLSVRSLSHWKPLDQIEHDPLYHEPAEYTVVVSVQWRTPVMPTWTPSTRHFVRVGICRSVSLVAIIPVHDCWLLHDELVLWLSTVRHGNRYPLESKIRKMIYISKVYVCNKQSFKAIVLTQEFKRDKRHSLTHTSYGKDIPPTVKVSKLTLNCLT